MSAEVQVTLVRRRVVAGLVCACVLVAAPHAGAEGGAKPQSNTLGTILASFEGPDRSPEGVQLTRFRVSSMRTPVGTGGDLMVEYTLTNLSADPIRVGANGLALAARIVAGGKEDARTLPSKNAGKVVLPGRSVGYTAVFGVDVAGTWHVAPVYDVEGHKAPARWHELSFDVVDTPGWEPLERRRAEAERRTAQRREVQLGDCGDPGTLPHGLAVEFHVRGLKPLRVGDELAIRWRYQNLLIDKPALFGPKGAFVAVKHARKGESAQRRPDLGQQFAHGVLRTYSPTRSLEAEARLVVDAPGTWVLWPSFQIEGDEAPERWCAVSVEVEE